MILAKKIKKEIQDHILKYVETMYNDLLQMKTKNEIPVPYQIISLPNDQEELWIYDKTYRNMLKVSAGAEVLVVSEVDEENFVKVLSLSFPTGHAEIHVKYIKEIGYN